MPPGWLLANCQAIHGIFMYRWKFLSIRCPWVTRRYGDDGSGLMMAGFRIIVLYCSPWPLFLLGGPVIFCYAGDPENRLCHFLVDFSILPPLFSSRFSFSYKVTVSALFLCFPAQLCFWLRPNVREETIRPNV